MTWTSLNLWNAAPEAFLLLAALTLLLVDLFVSCRNITYGLTLAVLAMTAVLLLRAYSPAPEYAFARMYVADPLATIAKIAMVAGVALVLIYGRSYAMVRGLFRGELFSLSLLALLGMMIMASALNFVTLYVGLELLSLSLCALVALRRDSLAATEAAMKYFVLAALASGLLLYGMSMIYGATGSLDILTIADRIRAGQSNHLFVIFGIVFVVAGISFKLGLVPFHMWVPDLYEGAPTLLAQLIGSAPKVAGFAFAFRLLGEGLIGFVPDWQSMLAIVAVASLAIGNIVAIVQTSLKRMLAYSTISHMGFMTLGLLAGNQLGFSAAFFYAVTYMLTAAAGFGMIMLLSRDGFESDQIVDFKGLAKRSPWLAFMMLIVMFSMAGIPVFVGFFAKLAVLKAIVAQGLVWLAVTAVIFSLIGAFYYLRIVKIMYFDPPETTEALTPCALTRGLVSVNCLALLALGLLPDALLNLLHNAVQWSWHL